MLHMIHTHHTQTNLSTSYMEVFLCAYLIYNIHCDILHRFLQQVLSMKIVSRDYDQPVERAHILERDKARECNSSEHRKTITI